MKYYQLIAIGYYAFHNGTGRVHSRKIFTDKESANKYISVFTEMCITPIDDNDLFFLDKVSSVKIIELEVVDTITTEISNECKII